MIIMGIGIVSPRRCAARRAFLNFFIYIKLIEALGIGKEDIMGIGDWGLGKSVIGLCEEERR